MSYSDWNITCNCKHVGPMLSFAVSQHGLELPIGEWRCPKCGQHVRLVRVRDKILPDLYEVRVLVIKEGRTS